MACGEIEKIPRSFFADCLVVQSAAVTCFLRVKSRHDYQGFREMQTPTADYESRYRSNDTSDVALKASPAKRARDIIHREVSFIFNSEFEDPDADHRILTEPAPRGDLKPDGASARYVDGYDVSVGDVPLLTAEEERNLFRRMNYLKFRSTVLKSQLNPGHPDPDTLELIERLMDEGNVMRNHIVEANTRLVVSIAHRLRNASESFDEMISTGNVVLIKAAERFDYSRGFRFSTYATHSIQRELFRLFGKGNKRRNMETTIDPEILLESLEADGDSRRHLEHTCRMQYIKDLMQKVLPDREMQVVISRFGLNSEGRKVTLREIGEKLGLSKERVRQLQTRAIQRLQQFARENIPDSPPIGFDCN